MDQPTRLLFNNEARKKILIGVNRLYDAVRMSMGPQGGNALIYGLYSRPYRITNDGYTIAEIIELKDEFENLAARAFRDAANRTNLLAGDGTTATCVIGGKLLNDVLPKIMQAESTADFEKILKRKTEGVMDIKRKLLATKDIIVEKLKEVSKKVETKEELVKLATISVEDAELGKLIAEMSWKVGLDGYIDILEGFKGQIETETIEGTRFPAKVPAKVFVNNLARYEMVGDDVPVILTNFTVDSAFMAVLNAKIGGQPKLCIIAPDFKDNALISMAQVNKKNAQLIYVPVKVPSLKTVQFEDIKVASGARFINKDRGDKIENVTSADLGFFSKIVVKDADTREDAVALGGKGTRRQNAKVNKEEMEVESVVEARVRELKEAIENTKEGGQKELLRRRIAGLCSAVGIIRVSKDSEGETYYWKKKIEDAVYACRAALQEGYVKGGGLALKEIAETLPEDDMLRPALLACYEQIQENAGGITIGEDVIDPTKAIRCAVEHAVSVVANLATVKVMIPHEREGTPMEGYEKVANAIKSYVWLVAKEKGIALENEEEIAKDEMARHDAILRGTIN